MQSWNTVEEVEEEMDIFAELGAIQPTATPILSVNETSSSFISNDPLAAFMDDEEENTLTADSLFALEDEPDGAFEFISEPQVSIENASGPMEVDALQTLPPALSNEVITELLEVLVKKELNSRIERGEDWLSDLPPEAVAQIESAKVVKKQEAYHLSLIIDMEGTTGQIRPFATVLSTGEGVLPVSPPAHLTQSWHSLYNALRDLLLQAMNSLSKLNVVIGNSTA